MSGKEPDMTKTIWTFIKLVFAACVFLLGFVLMGAWMFVPIGLGLLWAVAVFTNQPQKQ